MTRTIIHLEDSTNDKSKTFYCNGCGIYALILEFIKTNPTFEQTVMFLLEKGMYSDNFDIEEKTSVSKIFSYLSSIDFIFIIDFSSPELTLNYLKHFPNEEFDSLQNLIDKY